MSDLRQRIEKDPIVLIACSDLHLSHRAPVARSQEPNWYETMRNRLLELNRLVLDLSTDSRIPVVVAGDIFDDGWRANRCPPELISFAIECLPFSYAIPGQHDLPNHQYKEIVRTAYWVLVQSGVLYNLPPAEPIVADLNVVLYGFPWGSELKPLNDPYESGLNIAVVHSFLWKDEHGYTNAPNDRHLNNIADRLRGYDVAIFGDNHKGFISEVGTCKVINCGSFFRRKVDEAEYRPMVGLIHRSGRITPYYLDCSQDNLLSKDQARDVANLVGTSIEGLEGFVHELAHLGESGVNFVDNVLRYMDKQEVRGSTRELVLSILGADYGKR